MTKNSNKPKTTILYIVIRFLAGIVTRLLFRIKIIGRENIPDTGGFIVAGNHRSMWDLPVLAMAINNRQLSFLAKEELFGFAPLGFIFKKLGAFPVSRGMGDFAALDVSAEIIQNGGITTIFPEGTRSLDGIPLKPKSGIGLVVHKGKADVLPFSIYIEGRYKFFRKITIRFGKLEKYENFNLNNDKLSSKERKRVTNEIMDKILLLLEEGHAN